MQEMGIAFEIETNNLKQLYVCVRVCVYALSKPWEMQAKKPQSINTKEKKKKWLKHNIKDGHQTTREENKRRCKEKRTTKTNPKQLRKWL